MSKSITALHRSSGEFIYPTGCVLRGPRLGETAVTERGNTESHSDGKNAVGLSHVSGRVSESVAELATDSRHNDFPISRGERSQWGDSRFASIDWGDPGDISKNGLTGIPGFVDGLDLLRQSILSHQCEGQSDQSSISPQR